MEIVKYEYLWKLVKNIGCSNWLRIRLLLPTFLKENGWILKNADISWKSDVLDGKKKSF